MLEDVKPIRTPFRGGAIKSKERVLINGWSDKNNLRDKHPGWVSRKGQARLHTTADAAQEVCNIFQFVDRALAKSFYAQRVDGSVHKATSNPPAVTTGNFGSEVLATATGTIPASTSILYDNLLYSDGARQHRVYCGTGQRVRAFIVYKGAAAIPVIPEIGEDYTDEITDSDTTRVALLNSLSTLAAFDAVYICTDTPVNSLTFTMVNTNSNAATIALKYWNGAWTAPAGLADGTALAGATFGQSGAVTWTLPTDEIDYYQFGLSGFWYQLSVSAALDATVSVAEVKCTCSWQSIINVWDGVMPDAPEVMVYRHDELNYFRYSGLNAQIGEIFDNTSDYVYFVTTDPIFGFYADMGATPNVNKITGSWDCIFHDSGTGDDDDYVMCAAGDFLEKRFEAGMSIVVTNTTSNNVTFTAKNVTSNRIYAKAGTFANETDTTSTLTYDNTGATFTMEYWNGAAYAAVTTLTDQTASFTKSGFVTFARTTSAQPSSQSDTLGSAIYGYWYRFKLNKTTSRNCGIHIMYLPFFKIADKGNGVCNAAWKGRPVYSFDKNKAVIEIGAMYRPMSLNGLDYLPFDVGDGRQNKVLAMCNYYQDLLVFQEEIGEKGGCITMVQGFNPTNFGRLLISDEIGIINPKSYAMVDGVATPQNPRAAHAKMVYFISRHGVYEFDGTDLVNISGDISIYFDPTNANCIRDGYEMKHWLSYDSAYNCIRVGLCTGSSATTANTFLVYDIEDRTWGTDTLGQNISCMTEIEAGSGAISIISVGGSVSDGFIYQLNTGTDDVGATTAAVNAYATYELDSGGLKLDINTMQLRVKAQSAGAVTIQSANNGNTSYANCCSPSTATMVAKATDDTYVYNDMQFNRSLEDHISLKFSHNTAGEECYLLDFALLDIKGKNVIRT